MCFEAFAELLPHQARNDICDAARREGDGEGDVLRRIGLGLGGVGEAGGHHRGHHGGKRTVAKLEHAMSFRHL